MTNDIDLDAIEARASAATKGPWTTGVRWEDPCDVYWMPINRPGSDPENLHQPDRIALIRYETCGFQYPHFEALSDAAFIANARTDVPKMAAEIRRLREQLFAQKPIIDAAETWAEAHEESDPEATIRATADLYGAVEQYRLMDHALTTARTEQPEATR